MTASRRRLMGLRARSGAYVPLLLVLAIFAPVVLAQTHGDAFQFWYAGHLAASRTSVYDQLAWYEAPQRYGDRALDVAINCATPESSDCLWLYPPWTALVFVPLGVLPPEVGIPLLRVAVALATVGALLLAVRLVNWRSAWGLALALVIAAASQPLQLTLANSQIDAFLVIGGYLVWRGLRDADNVLLALGAMGLAVKPHLALALGAAVAMALVAGRRSRALILMGGALAGLVVVGYAVDPLPLATLLGQTASKAAANNATVWALGDVLVPGNGMPVALLLTAVAGASVAVAFRSAPAEDRDALLVAGALALSRVVAPYAHTYDDLLLVPAVVLVVAFAGRLSEPAHSVALTAIVAVVIIFSWTVYVLIAGAGSQAISSLVSVLTVVVLAFAATGARAPAPNATPRR